VRPPVAASLLIAIAVTASTGCDACGAVLLPFTQGDRGSPAQQKLHEECGFCESGTTCNFLASPARCTSQDGPPGTPCGEWQDPTRRTRAIFSCAEGLRCARDAGVEAGVCAIEAPEDVGGE